MRRLEERPLSLVAPMLRSLSFAALWLLLPAFPVLAADTTQDEMVTRISQNVMCTCGCPHILNQCGDECGFAPQRIQELTGLAKAGKSEEQIYAELEQKYGPAVLAVPRAEGFNLLVWVMPFLALLAGAVLIVAVIRNLKPEAASTPPAHPGEEMEDRYRKLLEERLRE